MANCRAQGVRVVRERKLDAAVRDEWEQTAWAVAKLLLNPANEHLGEQQCLVFGHDWSPSSVFRTSRGNPINICLNCGADARYPNGIDRS